MTVCTFLQHLGTASSFYFQQNNVSFALNVTYIACMSCRYCVGCSSYLLLHPMNGGERSSKLLDGIRTMC